MIREVFLRRFGELHLAFGRLPYAQGNSVSTAYVPEGQWRKWATSVESLIVAAVGRSSIHSRNFGDLYTKCTGYDHEVKALFGVFESAKEDFEGGYVFNVDLRVSGEVFGDFVVLARRALSEGHKDVAAVLSCAALEDALKRFAISQDIDVDARTMAEVVNALKSEGLVSGAQKSLLDAMPRIRNLALHADWGKITEPDVSSVIGFVEQFLLTKFNGS
jgi:Domain of unknown function (DUF4145)